MESKAERQKILETDPTYFIFNFGNSFEFTIKEIAFKIKKTIGYDGEFIYSYPADYPFRPVIEEYLSVDASKANKILNWFPHVSLDSGLKNTIEHWKDFFSLSK